MSLEFKYICAIIAGICLLGIIISIPFRRKMIKKNSGALIKALPSSSVKIFGGYLICAAIIIFMLLTKYEYAWYLTVLLDAAAVIGAEICARESKSYKITGFYENAIVWGVYFIPYENIYSLPTLAYENDKDTVGVDFQYLQIMLKNNKEVQMFFESKEERNEAVKIILKKREDLRN